MDIKDMTLGFHAIKKVNTYRNLKEFVSSATCNVFEFCSD